MPLTSGTRLGPYEIIAPLGAGGMGEVYRARDARLERIVAIKVLPSNVSSDAHLRERLLREARAISSLSHPHICALYDIGHDGERDYLVMEYLEGESLADRLARTPPAPREALRIGEQIAGALARAHRAGIIHRDLKPANVMLTKSGAKLLDFGLAKEVDEPSVDRDAPTRKHNPMTEPGTIVGTLQYMAPEQLEARAVDPRTDIFALGALLYEMLSGGRRAFEAPSRVALMNKILLETPSPLSSGGATIAPSVERLVQKCLEKEPERRWQSAADVADEIRWLSDSGSTSDVRVLPAESSGRDLPWRAIAAILAALLLLGAVAAIVAARRAPAEMRAARVITFGVEPPPGTTLNSRAVSSELALSPDGTHLAFCAIRAGKRQLYLRSLAELVDQRVEGADGATSPFWSPDSKWIGFFVGNEMKKAPAAGGPIQTICKAQGTYASWNARGQIVFSEWGPGTSDAIQMVSADGGPATAVTGKDGWHNWAYFLPDGEHFLFTIMAGDAAKSGIYLAKLGSPIERRLSTAASRAEISRDGGMYYQRDGALVRQRFDLDKLEISGEPTVVANTLSGFAATFAANFSVSADGSVIAYLGGALPTELLLKERTGRKISVVLDSTILRQFSFDADEKRVAFDRVDPNTQGSDLWLYDRGRRVSTRITSNRGIVAAPLWITDHDLLVTEIDATNPSSPPQLAVRTLGAAEPRFLLRKEGVSFPTSLTPSRSHAIYTVNRGDVHGYDVEMISLGPGATKTPLVSSDYVERDGRVSPDGRWLAFESDESGQPDVFIAPLAHLAERVRVSSDGGTEARWSADGRELYFLSAAGMLTAASVDANGNVGAVDPLFAVRSASLAEFGEFGQTRYQPLRDGKFVVREPVEAALRAPIVVMVRQ